MDFKLNYDKICIEHDENLAPKDQFSFLNQSFKNECTTSIGDLIVDKNYLKNFNINNFELYKVNGVVEKLSKHTEFKEESLKYDNSIHQGSYYYLNDHCRYEVFSKGILD